jgi:hypothetical protein
MGDFDVRNSYDLMKEYTGLQLITCNYDINQGFSQSFG